MASRVFARRPALIFAVLLAVTPTVASANDPSPRRQAELDSVVARHRSERQRKTRAAAQYAAGPA